MIVYIAGYRPKLSIMLRTFLPALPALVALIMSLLSPPSKFQPLPPQINLHVAVSPSVVPHANLASHCSCHAEIDSTLLAYPGQAAGIH